MSDGRPLLLAIDAGTQACKAVVFDAAGEEVSRGVVPYAAEAPRPGWSELRPEVLFGAAQRAVREAVEAADGALAALGVSAQLGMAAVDEDGAPLGNVRTWMDKRAVEEAALVRSALDQDASQITGRRVDPEWPACQIVWLKRNEPQQYARAAKFLSLKDLIVLHLTSRAVTDPTHASYTLLFHVGRRAWHEPFLKALDIEAAKLPAVREAHELAGSVTEAAAAAFGVPVGLPVIVGGPDGTVGAVGAGLVRPGVAVNVVGTTDVLFACSREPLFDDAARILTNCHAVEGLWGLGGPMTTTGGCVQWFCDHVAGTSPRDLDTEAAAVAPGAERLLCLPGLVGDRVPDWDPTTRGVFFGLRPEHTRAHLHRAILEGSAFVARHVLEIVEGHGVAVDRVHLVGGGAQSDLWAQVRADVFGKTIVTGRTKEGTCLGTSILAGIGVGIFPDAGVAHQHAFREGSTFYPDASRRVVYDGLYQEHRKLRAALGGSFQRLADA